MDPLLRRYLAALDVPSPRPDLPTLAALLGRHAATFPYETLGMALAHPYSLDPRGCVERSLAGMPGYCYTQNTGFAWVLEELGFRITRHLGVVTGRGKPEPGEVTGGHLALTVRLDGQDWLADAGLGAGPAVPIPLEAGEVTEGAWRHRLERSPVPGATWRLAPDPRMGGFATMDFAAAPAAARAFLPLHEQRRLIGEAGAPYFLVQRASGDRVDMVVGDTYRCSTGASHGPELTVLADVAAWQGAVRSLGCRALEQAPPARVTTLFDRLHREGEAFRNAC